MNNPPRPSRILFPVVLLIALAVGFALVSQSPSSATQAGSRVALQTTPDAVEEAKPTDAPAPEDGTPFGPITGATAVATVAVTPVPGDPYDPATYGIPSVIAGYRSVLVFTPSTQECMPSGNMQLILETTAATVEEHLANSNAEVVRQELEQLGFEGIYWEIVIGNGPFDRNELININNSWNEAMRNGCPFSVLPPSGN